MPPCLVIRDEMSSGRRVRDRNPTTVPVGTKYRKKPRSTQRVTFEECRRRLLRFGVVLRGNGDGQVRPEASLRIVRGLTRGCGSVRV